jgi:hypothetical protein
VLWPPVISSLAGLAVVLAGSHFVRPMPILQVPTSALAYGTVVALVLRFLFPQTLSDFLARLPGGRRMQTWFRLDNRETFG